MVRYFKKCAVWLCIHVLSTCIWTLLKKKLYDGREGCIAFIAPKHEGTKRPEVNKCHAHWVPWFTSWRPQSKLQQCHLTKNYTSKQKHRGSRCLSNAPFYHQQYVLLHLILALGWSQLLSEKMENQLMSVMSSSLPPIEYKAAKNWTDYTIHSKSRSWQIMFKFLPIVLFLYSPIPPILLFILPLLLFNLTHFRCGYILQIIIILFHNTLRYFIRRQKNVTFFDNCFATWLRVEHSFPKQTPSEQIVQRETAAADKGCTNISLHVIWVVLPRAIFTT